MHIEQVDHVKLRGFFFIPTLTTSTHINNLIAVMNQRVCLLKQLRKQGHDIRGVTQRFIGLVVARFHYALPAIVGQMLVNDLNRIDAIFSKAFRRQLISIVPTAADIVDNADKKTIPLCSHLHPFFIHHMLPPIQNAHGRFLRFKGHGRVLPIAKNERYKNSFLIRCLYRYA